MRSIALASVLAAAVNLVTVVASPTPTEPEQPHKRASLPAVTASGNAFWQGSTRFYIRGVDYQPGGSSAMKDPLADTTVCERDITEFKKLGINTIRVYMTDNSANHDTCMNALADAGVYLIVDVNNPLYSINRFAPGPSYNAKYLQSVFATIDEFVKYDNTLAFFSGNEVINDNVTSTLSARYVKATTRDMRQYISNRGYRKIPVGYSAADVSQNRMQLAQYMNCGSDEERSDFFAFNDYSWCNTNFATAGWGEKVKNFTGYGIPIFLSEYGCITNGRDFGEVKALMSDQMTSVYSGGLMYEYALEENGYGIVKIPSSDSATVEEQPEFAKFAKALSANPAPTGSGGFTSTTNSVPCPTKDANWLIDSTELPSLPDGAKDLMKTGAGAGPGLKGAGSQNAGTGDTGNATPSSAGSTATSSSKNSAGLTAGPLEKAPLIIAGLVCVLTMTGTLLL
ncbi:Glucanosyltransferase-domain-containing protein [Podospora appendiculata]|uniref:1,3-beta-glucanosyltransferase n=1 Tax=Podospora appendiculata TaxID=314037 RepID=A0AAE0X688_9PEZI|nr:Glucanosyltransferase-domain-containing protein [Podospora appendiculata]